MEEEGQSEIRAKGVGRPMGPWEMDQRRREGVIRTHCFRARGGKQEACKLHWRQKGRECVKDGSVKAWAWGTGGFSVTVGRDGEGRTRLRDSQGLS